MNDFWSSFFAYWVLPYDVWVEIYIKNPQKASLIKKDVHVTKKE